MTHHSLRDPRYWLQDSRAVEVSIAKRVGAETIDLDGELVDLSRRGVQVRLKEPLERGERVRLTMVAEASDFEAHSYARVRWVESVGRQEWQVGCTLENHIEGQSIDTLAKDGAMERRQNVREPVSCFDAQIKFELEPELQLVQILDLSAGGFSTLSSHLGAKPGNRVLLEVRNESDTHLIRARVSWVNDFESGQAIGCAFADEDDHLLMRAAAFGTNNRAGGKPRCGATDWISIAAGTVLIIVLLQLFWL